jgi:hypothetical protein
MRGTLKRNPTDFTSGLFFLLRRRAHLAIAAIRGSCRTFEINVARSG